MSFSHRTVMVELVPEISREEEGRIFLRKLERSMEGSRPSIVLDCSSLVDMSRSAVHLILCCLEEALKRNGDVRLARLSARAIKVLESLGADRLFRIFDSNADAINSFHHPATGVALHEQPRFTAHEISENAA